MSFYTVWVKKFNLQKYITIKIYILKSKTVFGYNIKGSSGMEQPSWNHVGLCIALLFVESHYNAPGPIEFCSGMECLHRMLCRSWRTRRTVRNYMNLLFIVITKLFITTTIKKSKLFIRETLNISHITIFISTLSSIYNRYRLGNDNIMKHGFLVKRLFFFSKFLSEKFANIDIQRRNMVLNQQNTYDNHKFQTKFLKKLILLLEL